MKTLLLFPGQGVQRLGMAAQFQGTPLQQRMKELADPGLLKVMWEGPKEELDDTENA